MLLRRAETQRRQSALPEVFLERISSVIACIRHSNVFLREGVKSQIIIESIQNHTVVDVGDTRPPCYSSYDYILALA